jgi:hypothetical protein
MYGIFYIGRGFMIAADIMPPFLKIFFCLVRKDLSERLGALEAARREAGVPVVHQHNQDITMLMKPWRMPWQR